MSAVLVRAVRWVAVVFLLLVASISSFAQSQNILRGRISDPVGQSVANAKVAARQDGQEVAHAISNADGVFELSLPAAGRYSVGIEADGFAPANLEAPTAL